MILKKFIIIFLLAFTLNIGIQSSRILSQTQKNIIESVIEQNYSKDNDEFIKKIENGRFAEMVKLYISILKINKNNYYNTS